MMHLDIRDSLQYCALSLYILYKDVVCFCYIICTSHSNSYNGIVSHTCTCSFLYI